MSACVFVNSVRPFPHPPSKNWKVQERRGKWWKEVAMFSNGRDMVSPYISSFIKNIEKAYQKLTFI